MTPEEVEVYARAGLVPKGEAQGALASGASLDGVYDSFFKAKTKKDKSLAEEGLENASLKVNALSAEAAYEYHKELKKRFPNIHDVEKPKDIRIPLNKATTAIMAGTGDQLGDSWRGIQQVLTEAGIGDYIDTKQQDENERLLTALYQDDNYGNLAKGGAVLGAITEPLGLMIPGMKFKHAAGAILYAAGVGGLYGSSLYVSDDESRLNNAMWGVAFGGGLGVAGSVGGSLLHKFFKQAVGSEVEGALVKTLGQQSEKKAKLPRTDKVGGKVEKDWFEQQVKELGKKKKKPAEVAADNLEQLEVRASVKGPRNVVLGKARGIVDSFLQPLYNNVRKYSPKIAAGLRKVDFETHSYQKAWMDRIQPFQKWANTLSVSDKVGLHKMLLNDGISKKTLREIEAFGGKDAVKGLLAAKTVLKEILKGYKKAGYKIKAEDAYFPRSVKDLESLSKHHQAMLDKATRGLEGKAKEAAVAKLLSYDPRFSNTASSLRKRSIRKVKDEQVPYYHDPVTSLYHYISSAAEDLATRKFFKGFGYTPTNTKGLDVTGADINKSIDKIVENFSYADKNDLVKLLKSRFASDVHGTHGFIQGMKNVSYAATLGNYWSAMTQVGDLVFAFHKYGIGDTVASILGKNMSTKEKLGIDKAMQELNSSKSLTSDIADFAFKWGGFDAMDRFGKNVNINSSLRQNKRLAIKDPAKFKKKWETHFGDETDTLITELQNMQFSKEMPMSDNAKLMLWNDLADTQPIGLAEMPMEYLRNPNGRIFYAYKTFTLKQMNYMRETLRRGEGNPATNAANLVYFATLFTLANGGIDGFKEFMSGEERIEIEDRLIDNALGLLWTSKYAVDKSAGIGSILYEMLPPVPVTQAVKLADTAHKAIEGDSDSAGALLHNVPVLGKIAKEWELF